MLDIVEDNEIGCKNEPGDYLVSKLLWKGVHSKVLDQRGL